MKGIYLFARKHRIPGVDLKYNDIINFPGIDFCCDFREVDLTPYDYYIATPPCNYYSRANWRRETSFDALFTKDFLPLILSVFSKQSKPFIIENVCNSTLLPKSSLYEFDFGNHHFYTNVFLLVPDKSFSVFQNKQYVSRSKRDGNYNVDFILKLFLEAIGAYEK